MNNNHGGAGHAAGHAAGRWTWCGDRIPPTGVHRTARQLVETTFKLPHFQHFDGSTWGAIALDAASALALASTPSQFRPTYWLNNEEQPA